MEALQQGVLARLKGCRRNRKRDWDVRAKEGQREKERENEGVRQTDVAGIRVEIVGSRRGLCSLQICAWSDAHLREAERERDGDDHVVCVFACSLSLLCTWRQLPHSIDPDNQKGSMTRSGRFWGCSALKGGIDDDQDRGTNQNWSYVLWDGPAGVGRYRRQACV